MRTALSLGIAGAVGAATFGGVGYAVASSGGSTLTACASKSTGALRYPGAHGSCKGSEKKLSWNAAGVKGATGAQGVQGVQGVAGLPGALPDVYVADKPNPSGPGINIHGADYLPVVSVSVPAGNYVVTAAAELTTTLNQSSFCYVFVGGIVGGASIVDGGGDIVLSTPAASGDATYSSTGVVTVTAQTSLVLGCTGPTGALAQRANLTAVKAGTVH